MTALVALVWAVVGLMIAGGAVALFVVLWAVAKAWKEGGF